MSSRAFLLFALALACAPPAWATIVVDSEIQFAGTFLAAVPVPTREVRTDVLTPPFYVPEPGFIAIPAGTAFSVTMHSIFPGVVGNSAGGVNPNAFTSIPSLGIAAEADWHRLFNLGSYIYNNNANADGFFAYVHGDVLGIDLPRVALKEIWIDAAGPPSLWSFTAGTDKTFALSDFTAHLYLYDWPDQNPIPTQLNSLTFHLKVTDSGHPLLSAVPEPGTWALMLLGLGLLWIARRRALLAAALLGLSLSAQAALFTAADSHSGLVDEYPSLRPGNPCLKTPCAIDRALSPMATEVVKRVVLTLSIQQSPFSDTSPAAFSLSLKHNGQSVLITPVGMSAWSGEALTLTFDDASPNVRGALGFQESGTYHPTEEPLSNFNEHGAAGPWVLTVTEYHENTGYTRYLGSSIQVWTGPAIPYVPAISVPEPGTWVMMLVGLVGLCGIGKRYA